MGSEFVSGLCTTNGPTTSPLMTFIWDAIESTDALNITVRFGPRGDTPFRASASIPVGSTDPVTIRKADGTVEVGGTLTAAWANQNRSYVVTYSGQMLIGNVNNVFSSDLNGVPGDKAEIIVCAYLGA